MSTVYTRLEKFSHLLNAAERALFYRLTAQEQESLLLQLEKQTPVGQARYQPVQSSLTSNWRDTKKI